MSCELCGNASIHHTHTASYRTVQYSTIGTVQYPSTEQSKHAAPSPFDLPGRRKHPPFPWNAMLTRLARARPSRIRPAHVPPPRAVRYPSHALLTLILFIDTPPPGASLNASFSIAPSSLPTRTHRRHKRIPAPLLAPRSSVRHAKPPRPPFLISLFHFVMLDCIPALQWKRKSASAAPHCISCAVYIYLRVYASSPHCPLRTPIGPHPPSTHPPIHRRAPRFPRFVR